MKKYFLIPTLLLALFFSNDIFAQKLELEKTYTITGKSKRGYLGNVVYNKDSKTYQLTYVTKASEKMAKFQVYTFDKEFNFVDVKEEDLEFEKASKKFVWFKYRGESYSVEGLNVGPNLAGTLVLKRKRVTYTWNWFTGGYIKKTEILEKLKPKNDQGESYFYTAHAEDDITGDVLVLAGVKDKAKGSDPYKPFREFALLKFNKDLDLISTHDLKFDYVQTLAYVVRMDKTNVDDPDNPAFGGITFIFAPKGGDGSKPANENKKAYTYVRVNENGEVVEKLPFESPASYWKIDGFVLDEPTGNIYVFGPSAEGKDKYYQSLTATTKFKAIQLMRVANGKIDYITSANLEEIASKIKTPPSQKKTPEYEGKKFDIKGYQVASNGEFFMFGQNYKPKENGIEYVDVIGFHFDNQGKLKAQYGVDTKETNNTAKSYGAPQMFIEGADAKKMYWILEEVDGLKEEDGGSSHAKMKLLIYPRVAAIDMQSATVTDFVTLGKVGKATYYLDNRFPFLPVEDGNAIVFFGNDKPGKVIWFAKLKLD